MTHNLINLVNLLTLYRKPYCRANCYWRDFYQNSFIHTC